MQRSDGDIALSLMDKFIHVSIKKKKASLILNTKRNPLPVKNTPISCCSTLHRSTEGATETCRPQASLAGLRKGPVCVLLSAHGNIALTFWPASLTRDRCAPASDYVSQNNHIYIRAHLKADLTRLHHSILQIKYKKASRSWQVDLMRRFPPMAERLHRWRFTRAEVDLSHHRQTGSTCCTCTLVSFISCVLK